MQALTGSLFQRFWLRPWVRLLIARIYFSRIPHGRILGFRVIGATATTLEAEMPYQTRTMGNPWSGALHGGAVAALIDQICGAAASLAVRPPVLVATLDLRIDWLRTPPVGQGVRAVATCSRVTRYIVFVDCTAYAGNDDRPLARASGVFMRTGSVFRRWSRRLGERPQRTDDPDSPS